MILPFLLLSVLKAVALLNIIYLFQAFEEQILKELYLFEAESSDRTSLLLLLISLMRACLKVI